MITEHGNHVRVLWNDDGQYSAPQNITTGDMHGLSVADYDNDGRMDLIMAQGGGDGKNPRRPLHFQINKDRTFDQGQSLNYFQPGRGRAIKFIDPDEDGNLDLLLTGFPLKSQPEGANHLYRNAGSGRFDFVGNLPQAQWLGYRTLLTDFNNDFDSDILFFGGKDIAVLKGQDGLAYQEVSQQILGALANTSDVSSMSEIDFDNDGDFDLFLTRSEAQFDIESYYDPAHQRFAFLTFRKDFLFEDLKISGDLRIENLQQTYPNFDVFVGADKRKLTLEGDRHGGKNMTINKDQAKGCPTGETKGGLYIGYLGNDMWRIGGQSHSRLAGVIDNVVSTPSIEPQRDLPALLLENRDGVFVDVTHELGLHMDQQTTSAAVGDFNNDGWADLAVLKYGDMAAKTKQIVYLNQQGKGFLPVARHGILSEDLGTTGGSIEAFDYDLDGVLDLVYSDERGKWHLMRNNTVNTEHSHFNIVKVGRSPTGKASPQGAVMTVQACTHLYKRRIGSSSAAFSQSMNTNLHLGLGTCEKIDTATVRWSNGEVEKLAPPQVDTITNAGLRP
ncbi:hypothetical protein GPLA_2082 [Paraglaciecola polaris LMG 21857]|uniref:ASPIC/UnbV domain-containing protein n=1 Tax=Paraglaciecola polaris LMG 21857 TaxID=1129793 RepID=K6ZRQ4_9ALTE|nr:hypothetical protein GPLA_2082 [Paraglaciecola polaris LMG 21857]